MLINDKYHAVEGCKSLKIYMLCYIFFQQKIIKMKIKSKFRFCTTFAGLVSLFSILFLLSFNTSLSGQKSDVWKAPASAKKLENPVPVNPSILAKARKTYAKECYSCHGKKGKGDGPNSLDSEKKVPNLLKPNTQDQTDGELYWKITNGRKPMPSAKKALTDEQRWAVVHYLRNLYEKYGKKKK